MVAASQKQMDFIKSLLTHRDVPEYIATAINAVEVYPKVAAGEIITSLLKFPKRAAPLVTVAPGFYTDGTDTFMVVKAKTGINLYAKVLRVESSLGGAHDHASWDYAPGAMMRSGSWSHVTAEQAADFGKRYGVCMVCTRTLTNPGSVAAGIGPVCAGRF